MKLITCLVCHNFQFLLGKCKMGPFIGKRTTSAKVWVLTNDFTHALHGLFVKYQHYILNVISGTVYQYWNQTWPIL
jgi:hypothetical protein